MLKHILLSALLLLSFISLNLAAQEVPPEPNQDKAVDTVPREEAADAEKKEQAAKPESPDTFEPSEEISEDLSVSFPVDI
jgi:hypothetical protein